MLQVLKYLACSGGFIFWNKITWKTSWGWSCAKLKFKLKLKLELELGLTKVKLR